MQELRNLAHGIYPPLLVDRGLPEALSRRRRPGRPAHRRWTPRGSAATRPTSRRPCTSAASRPCRTRASTPATGATVTVQVWEDAGALLFEVADDGAGFDPAQRDRARRRLRQHERPARRHRRHLRRAVGTGPGNAGVGAPPPSGQSGAAHAVKSAIAMWVRNELTRRWKALVALGVLAGVVGGLAIAAVAGARRTSTAFERFREATGRSDAIVFGTLLGMALDYAPVRALPEVEDAGEFALAPIVLEGARRGPAGAQRRPPVPHDQPSAAGRRPASRSPSGGRAGDQPSGGEAARVWASATG